jgi:hypothetical protein
MAIRIHVTAVRNCPSAEVRAVMSEVIRPVCANAEECRPVGELLSIEEHNGWTWFRTSVWGVSAAELNRGLCQLARPALQFTTCDADRWYLTVHGGPTGQVHFVHHFGTHHRDPDPADDAGRQAELQSQEEPPIDPELAFLQDEPPPGPDRPRVPFDLCADEQAEEGIPVPEEFRASVAALPYSQAVARYRRWHAEQVSAALRAAGIPHAPDAVRAVLLWENVTDRELDSDLGNLPRLLSVLGLGGEWDDYMRQVEAPPEPATCEVGPAPAAPPPDYISPVLAITGRFALVPVSGGPVSLPLEQIGLLQFCVDALAVDCHPGAVLTVALPSGFDRARLTQPTERGTSPVKLTADGFQVGLPDNCCLDEQRHLDRYLGTDLVWLLCHLPDDSALDVTFAAEGHPALTQRYRGPVRDAQWQITETYPALTGEVLKEVFELAALGEQPKYQARDEAEALEIIARARRDPELWEYKVQRKGRLVRCKDDFLGRLPQLFLQHRYGEYWDVASYDRQAAREYEELVAQEAAMRRTSVEAARRRAAPHDEEILFRGQQSIYWRSDFARLTELEQDTRQKIDQAMHDLGFQHSGDLVAKKQRDIVLRAYASADGLSYGILMAKRRMYLGYEFFSRFADGTTLTTTTNSAVDSSPQTGIYYKTCPGLEIPALFERHRWGLDRFRTHRATEPVPLDGTLLGVARELDAAFARQSTVAS